MQSYNLLINQLISLCSITKDVRTVRFIVIANLCKMSIDKKIFCTIRNATVARTNK